MNITLFNDDFAVTRPLPEKIKGQFWFGIPESRHLKKFIELEGKDGSWLIYSGKDTRVFDTSGNFVRCAQIAPFQTYTVKTDLLGKSDEALTLFIEPDDKGSFRIYAEQGTDITVGSQKLNSLVYCLPSLAASHATLSYSGGKWSVVDNGSRNGTYVNGKKVRNAVALADGDTVYILGLTLTAGSTYLECTNPGGLVSVNAREFVPTDSTAKKYIVKPTESAPAADEHDSTGNIESGFSWNVNTDSSFTVINSDSASPLSMAMNGSDDDDDPGYEGATTILGMENTQAQKKPPHLLREKTGESVPVNKNSFTIGKTGCDYCITDNKAISRTHAVIAFDGSIYTITDNHSTNKTYLNEKALAPDVPAVLEIGAKLRLANEPFTFLA